MGQVINVKNFHLAKCKKTTSSGVSTYTWETPQHIPGAMKLSIVPITAKGEQYGDGILAVKISKRTGYTLGIDHNDIPSELKRYLNGLTYKDGVETDDGGCTSNPVAFGCEHEKADGSVEKIWFLYCVADPIEEEVEQATSDIPISKDTISLTALKLSEYNDRAYVKINSSDSNVTEDMINNFFKKVQTETTISAPTE
jgi:phi13 family phage major tail protein